MCRHPKMVLASKEVERPVGTTAAAAAVGVHVAGLLNCVEHARARRDGRPQ